jgi:hypothetical protein
MSDTTFPDLLSKLHALDYFHAEPEDDGEVMDFEPYTAFMSADDTRHWLRAWTGNDEVDGAAFRVFGQDGSGGYAAFWLVDPAKGILDQPVVFFGSEGELGVVASDFAHYLWLLAGGVGPYEAVAYAGELGEPVAEFISFAKTHSNREPMTPRQVLAEAAARFPTFVDDIQALTA